MWLRDLREAGIRRARLPALMLALFAAAALPACGFEPLYGDPSTPRGFAETVDIAPIDGPIGHLLRNRLIDGLAPTGRPTEPDYRLTVLVGRSTSPLLVQIDDSTDRYNLTLTASFTLADSTGATAYRGTAKATGSYNVVQSPFATLAAERNAERNLARELADEIRTLVLVHLIGRDGEAADF